MPQRDRSSKTSKRSPAKRTRTIVVPAASGAPGPRFDDSAGLAQDLANNPAVRALAAPGLLVAAQLSKPTPEAEARVAELRERWRKLHQWGVSLKLPHRRLTLEEWASWMKRWELGEPDVTAIQAWTASVEGLEQEANEYDTKRGVTPPFVREPMRTTFDIDRATTGIEAANATMDAVADLKKGAADLAHSTVGAVPGWVWAVGAAVGGLFVLSQLNRTAENVRAVVGRR